MLQIIRLMSLALSFYFLSALFIEPSAHAAIGLFQNLFEEAKDQNRHSLSENWKGHLLTPEQQRDNFNRLRLIFPQALLQRYLQTPLAELKIATDNLSEHEAAALAIYTSNEGYSVLNQFLRGAHVESAQAQALQAFTELLASAINRIPNSMQHKGRVYRGLRLSPLQIEAYVKVGNVIRDEAFVSTSTSMSIANTFSASGGGVNKSVILIIESLTGKRISTGMESEVLFLPGTTFQVTGYDHVENRHYIYLKEI